MDLGCIFKLSSFGEDYLPDSSREFRELPILQGFPDSSAGKESTCNAGDPSLVVGKICWRRDRLPTPVFLGFPCGSGGKESACNAGDLGLIPELGRSPGEGKR